MIRYNAKEGLFHSHVGWIFHKPNYPRMALIDKKDLEIDPGTSPRSPTSVHQLIDLRLLQSSDSNTSTTFPSRSSSESLSRL